MLEKGSLDERRRLVAWLLGVAPALALSKHGCRVVQKALEVSRAPDTNALVAQLEGSVTELYRSRHGNFVLTRMIELVPSASIGFVLDALNGCGAEAARHRFGCRALEQLLAHCSAKQLEGLFEELVEESRDLAPHPYGNFVVQAAFEHGTPAGRSRLLGAILPLVPMFATHRVASHVVQKAILWSGTEGQRAIVDVLLQARSPNSLVDIACCRCGSFTVEELSNVRACYTPLRDRLVDGLSHLNASKHGQRVIHCFNLTHLCPLAPGPPNVAIAGPFAYQRSAAVAA